MSQQPSALKLCTGCNDPQCNCIRMVWTPLSPDMWMCISCWAPRDRAEERQYRREIEVPTSPHLSCSFCDRLPPPEAILTALIRAGASVGALKSEQAQNEEVEEANRAETVEVPRRRAYPLKEAAQLMGMSLTKTKDEVRSGKIAIVRAGKRRRIMDAEINRYLLAKKSGPSPRR